MDLERVRNFGIVAHIDAGKTTVSEHVLFDAGVLHRFGNVDDGDTALDWMAEERERGITITAAVTSVPWREHRLELVDTPGHVDFTVEVERAMRVLDGAVLVLDGVSGVQAQTETVWRQMERHRVPCIAFVNKLDRPGADLMRTVAHLRQRLGARAFVTHWPYYADQGGHRALAGLVDLLSGRTWVFDADSPRAAPEELPLPAELANEVGVLRNELLEELASEDEQLLDLFADGREPPQDLVRRALRARTLQRTIVPVLAGAALRNFGIHPLLDAVVDLLPSPLDVPPITGRDPEDGRSVTCAPDPDASTCAFAFKLQALAHGDLTFVRIYAGSIAPGASLWNPRTRRFERVARVLRMHGPQGQPLERARAGEIVALTGLKQTTTGDTLCTKDAPVVLESLTLPEPVLTLWIEPRSTADRDKLHAALLRIEREDPSFHVAEDPESGRWLASGMGELHLEVVRHRLESEFHVRCNVGEPRVAYRETLRSAGQGEGRVERVVGGKPVFGAVEVAVEPDPALEQPLVEPVPDSGLAGLHRAAIDDALRLESQTGPRFGFPLVQVRIRGRAVGNDPARNSEAAFAEAATLALRDALLAGGIDLLEPWMDFEVEARAEFASAVLADLNARRAEVDDVAIDGELRSVRGKVPLARMFGYASAVRSLTQGQARFSLTPAGFRRVPESELESRGLST